MTNEWQLPDLEVEIERDESPPADGGFLRLRRLVLKNHYPAGEESRPYTYDVVERDALDAVAIVLITDESPLRVCLRSATRPPLLLRRTARLPLPADDALSLWEVPAGLVEVRERGEAGLRECASRETLEETGLAVPPDAFERLGRPLFLSPGVLAEQVHFLVATVDPARAQKPTEDGSPVEERARVRFVSLREAFEALGAGILRDAKTEVALSRLRARRPVPS
ncbi:MAG: NUDIX domain-containing protein [Deltaproteobacteria bacterium]|nr:NUDIX domain-containing protein [Deltaproteobacteria bacterium]